MNLDRPGPAKPRKRWHRWALSVGFGVGVVAVAFVPTETRQGLNYEVSSRTLPLYAKALDFVQRDSSYSRLVEQIVSPDASPEARALTLFQWTRANIRDTPAGFPVVDDHVSHIIIRGYGADDQKADVFTTLATYAGVPSYWTYIGSEPALLILSFVWLDRRWRVFDVENGLIFRTRTGGLASVEDVAGDPSVLQLTAPGREYESRPYSSYFEDFHPPTPPGLLRAESQMLWPRAFYRVKRFVGLGRREWQVD